jgi:esterase/lipase
VATLAFDGPGQGEMEHELAIEPAFENVIAPVMDWLAGRSDVDAGRVACGGISLGGYYASRAAAYEPRLRCAVNMGGPYDFSESLPTMPSMSQQAFQARTFSPSREVAFEKVKELTLRDCARLITMPFLIVFGKEDRIIDYRQAERLFAEISSTDKRLELYEQGNHIVNNFPYAYRPLVADWVAERLRS